MTDLETYLASLPDLSDAELNREARSAGALLSRARRAGSMKAAKNLEVMREAIRAEKAIRKSGQKMSNPEKKKQKKKGISTAGRAAIGAGVGALALGPIGAIGLGYGAAKYKPKKVEENPLKAVPKGADEKKVRQIVSHNITMEMEAGRPQKQAVAIAITDARKHSKLAQMMYPERNPFKKGEEYRGHRVVYEQERELWGYKIYRGNRKVHEVKKNFEFLLTAARNAKEWIDNKLDSAKNPTAEEKEKRRQRKKKARKRKERKKKEIGYTGIKRYRLNPDEQVTERQALRELLEMGEVPLYPEWVIASEALVKKRLAKRKGENYVITPAGRAQLMKKNPKATEYQVEARGSFFSLETGRDPVRRRMTILATSQDAARKKAVSRMRDEAEKIGYEYDGSKSDIKILRKNPGPKARKNPEVIVRPRKRPRAAPEFSFIGDFTDMGEDIYFYEWKKNPEYKVSVYPLDVLIREGGRSWWSPTTLPPEWFGEVGMGGEALSTVEGKTPAEIFRKAKSIIDRHKKVGKGKIKVSRPKVMGDIRVGRGRNPKKKTKKKKKKTKTEAQKLIEKSRNLWESYVAKPTKKGLRKMLEHLGRMEQSTAKTVQKEWKIAKAVAKKEAKRLKMKMK